MKKQSLDRRSLLKGMMAMPAVAALSGCSYSSSSAKIPLNIILHGTCAIEFDTDRRRASVLIPTVLTADGKDAHVYRVGNCQAEQDIAPLNQVISFNIPGADNNDLPASINSPRQFVVIRNKTIQRNNKGMLRNIFEFPYPEQLLPGSAHRCKHDGHKHAFFRDETLLAGSPTQVPIWHIFQYTI